MLLSAARLYQDMAPSENRSRIGWLALGTVLAAVVAYVTASFIGTVVFGLFVYYSTRPIYDRVRERIPGDTLAAGVSLFLLGLPALALVGYTGVVAYREARLVAGIQLPKLDSALFGAVVDPEVLYQRGLDEYLSTDRLQTIMDALVSAADTLVAVGVILIQAFVVLALAFYLLRDGRKLSDWFVASFGDDQEVLPEFLRAVDQSLESVFFGNILNALVTGALGALLFSLLNIVAQQDADPAAALTGLLTGVASLIPSSE
jgi:Predicted permease